MFTHNEKRKLAEDFDANEGLDNDSQFLGEALRKAFHNKQAVDELLDLVNNQRAPVNFRLDYGLEIKKEADFVYAFFKLLGGDEATGIPLENARLLVGDHAQDLKNYVDSAPHFFNILYAETANQKIIPLSEGFINNIKQYPHVLRANPEAKNSALIIAAGLRDPMLVNYIIERGKASSAFIPEDENGALVNFKGYFDDTAAVWSAILLDYDCLRLLLEEGAIIENLGISGSSLLHWVAAASTLNNDPERLAAGMKITKLLISHGANPLAKNKFGKTPLDYAQDGLLMYLGLEVATRQFQPAKKLSIL